MKQDIYQLLSSSHIIGDKSFIISKMLLEYNAREKDYKIHKELLKELIIKSAGQSRQLEEKNQKLEELNRQKNHFLGMAAHDLRNPIGAIQMSSSLLLDMLNENLSEEQTEFIKEIQNLSNYMLNLLNDLLDISKIESGSLNLDTKKHNYKDFISQTIKFNKPFAEQKNILLEAIINETIEEIEFDKNKLTQVINNLITNAIKFSHSHTKITVEVKKEGDYVITSVIDEGQGIPSHEIPDIFKEFHKASVKPTANETGTGLGLAIVKRIVEGHGGIIGVESKEGKGSRFFYKLKA
jgi:signal transduction histidine kinase